MRKRHQSRPPKKTETLELRVSQREKAAFLDACHMAGRSASEVLRRLMALFVIVQKQRRSFKIMMKRVFLKPTGAAITLAAVALVFISSLVFAPVAQADVQLRYRLAVEEGAGEVVSMGRADLDGGTQFEPITDTLGEAVEFALRAQPCTQQVHAACAPGHIYVEIDVWTLSEHGEPSKTTSSLIVKQGKVARFVAACRTGRL